MSQAGAVAVRIIGLPVVCCPAQDADRSKGSDDQEAEEIGTVTDVGVSEDGRVQWMRCRINWRGAEICVPADSFRIESDALFSSRARADLEACPEGANAEAGLVGVSVRTNEGEDLGKIANMLVEPVSFCLLGLELSNGRIRDWAGGRPLVVLEPSEGVGKRCDRHLILTSEARVAPPSTAGSLGAGTEELLTDEPQTGSLPLVRPIDWRKVRTLSEDQIRQKMAQVVWERRGSPQDGNGPDELLELVTPWAKELKDAQKSGHRDSLDDLALISGEHVEALRVFRLGGEPMDRGAPSEHPESAAASGVAAQSGNEARSVREDHSEEAAGATHRKRDRGPVRSKGEPAEPVEPVAPARKTASGIRSA